MGKYNALQEAFIKVGVLLDTKHIYPFRIKIFLEFIKTSNHCRFGKASSERSSKIPASKRWAARQATIAALSVQRLDCG